MSLERLNAGAFVVDTAGAVPSHRIGLMSMVPPGSKSRARAQWGFPRNVGDPVVSTLNPEGVTGAKRKRPQAVGGARHVDRSEENVPRLVPPSEGNEVRRDERQGVVAP